MENIITYMIEQKEWIFSGIGITVIGIMYKLIEKLIVQRKEKKEILLEGKEGIQSGKISEKNNIINNTINFNSATDAIDNFTDIINEADGFYEKNFIRKR